MLLTIDSRRAQNNFALQAVIETKTTAMYVAISLQQVLELLSNQYNKAKDCKRFADSWHWDSASKKDENKTIWSLNRIMRGGEAVNLCCELKP